MTVSKVTATNFEMFSGDTKVLNITVKDEADVVVDITGATIDFTLSRKAGDTPTESIAGTVTNGPAGLCGVTLNPVHTENQRGAWYWEVQLTDLSLRVSTIAYGTVTIRRDSTP